MILIRRSEVNFEFRREKVLVFCIKKRMLLLSEFHQNMKSGMITVEVVFEGVRFRPVVFTPLMASEGLLPLVLLTGKGSESQKPFLIVVIDELVTEAFLALLLFPILF